MPEFFVPHVDDPEAAEHLWQATKTFVEGQSRSVIESRRIFRLGYLHDGKHMEAEVGVPHPYGMAKRNASSSRRPSTVSYYGASRSPTTL